MNVQWINMTGFGPMAWNHGGDPLEIPSMMHLYEEAPVLILHQHNAGKPHKHPIHKVHKKHRPHISNYRIPLSC